MKPVIYGLSGETLTPDERAFFADAQPAGYILFRRNIADRAQLRALTDDLRALHGRDDLLIMIDQEGGRVARMQAPVWPSFPPGAVFDRLYDIAPSSAIAAARANAHAIAVTLAEVGINIDALPLLDVRQDGPATSWATAPWAPSRCGSPRLAAPLSKDWRGAGSSASSNICRAMAARWWTAIMNCRS